MLTSFKGNLKGKARAKLGAWKSEKMNTWSLNVMKMKKCTCEWI